MSSFDLYNKSIWTILQSLEADMQVAETIREPAQVNAIALKAYARVAEAWGLSLKEAASLADMSESTWKRARKPDFAGELTKDQLLRLSAVIGIYKSLELYFSDPLARTWFTRPNGGPLFGSRRPVDTAIDGGLPQILAVRTYLDALRGGA
jgi:uncharacterized protein (DUF2384 family)